ncbi:fructose-bisphosphate aldolase class II [Breznakia sp. PF5-3]|uniref:class II fructose-bisphosphate aldolase n=1 Tax=unclassified Breznakia TaxID=2623764 RepID=UPI002404DE78|nr:MULTISPECIES: class II fructose-bisphosphate aldolase [unclassified Breznakia]MDL2276712.1 class II fructose-bisphosphate aldolase [Breznakia sp. OttesenSCG-928-G09]MDF9824352.1 fructose-bisphosphate aldolase class II [Breznakia sp. PM6-1]MDF9835057.1 fructose-bisphosphate aldolase class II [Breznakia sp. PF5-3]MDF9837772.1 fructose-bisphosphate aldolase class II [Breznakia sp. PFB2-8]MDF9859651.1 fructose-bisphosphate aldolase class II [Breznakia sp. PH5-24]
MLVNMKQILEEAEKGGYAIGCINTPNVETLRAVIGAAEDLNVPIIIDHAQVHDPLIPIEEIGPKMVEYAKKAKVPVCVHLDHGSDYNFVMRAIRCGFSSIMYDLSALPFEENKAKLKAFTKLAHALDITVEAELGIMTSTEDDTHGDDTVWDNESIKITFTDPEQAAEFARDTGVDALAVCFGTAHGIYSEPPILDIERVKEMRKKMPKETRIVMHGGSGVDSDQVQAAISAGCSKINYYSYMAKAAAKHIYEELDKTQGSAYWHEVQESAYRFMREYAREVLTVFKNGK